MSPVRHLRSFGLLAALSIAAASALVHCASPTEEEEGDGSEDAITGVFNELGLGLRYDEKTSTVSATLAKRPLEDGEKLFIRVRAGKITRTSQKELDCGALAKDPQAKTTSGGQRDATGKLVYAGPKVQKSVIELVHLYDDPNWATGEVSAAQREAAKNPDPIVEACIMKGSKLKAKLQTNLAYAWDQGVKAENEIRTASLHLNAGDAGGGGRRGITEDNVNSQIEYGQLCVKELGEIPFFKKLGDGKYDTFDCRNLVGMHDDESTGPIPGVEGNHIPVTVDGVEQTKCSPGRELGPGSSSYSCMDKADHGMFLDRGGTQPGPMVVTARNNEGSHWLLLCRKVADNGTGMMKTHTFTDMAMIGTNPRTGRTCFFQNSIGSGIDGKHVPHPGDVEKSTTVWSSYVQSYCSGECHSADAFVHSPWIDGAKRSNGKPIVPKQGEHPDFLISDLSAPYNIIAGDKLGFKIPQQLVSDEVGACNNCHRLAGGTLKNFADWTTGTGEEYFSRMTDYGKKFENSHWMPPRLDGLTEETWADSKYGKALEFMKKCRDNPNDASCVWADVPRGRNSNPRPDPNDR